MKNKGKSSKKKIHEHEIALKPCMLLIWGLLRNNHLFAQGHPLQDSCECYVCRTLRDLKGFIDQLD